MKFVQVPKIKRAVDDFLSKPKILITLYLVILLVGLHSIILGTYIYYLTFDFYELIYASKVENFFYVKQAGLFLTCIGCFYLFPLLELKKYHHLIILSILTKVAAVTFLIDNARHTPVPGMIQLTAFTDGMMAVIMLLSYVICRIKRLI